MTEAKDPLISALDKAVPNSQSQNGGRIMQLYGDRPDVLESIKRARQERKLGYTHIAMLLTKNGNGSVSRAAVKSFLEKEGIE